MARNTKTRGNAKNRWRWRWWEWLTRLPSSPEMRRVAISRRRRTRRNTPQATRVCLLWRGDIISKEALDHNLDSDNQSLTMSKVWAYGPYYGWRRQSQLQMFPVIKVASTCLQKSLCHSDSLDEFFWHVEERFVCESHSCHKSLGILNWILHTMTDKCLQKYQ